MTGSLAKEKNSVVENQHFQSPISYKTILSNTNRLLGDNTGKNLKKFSHIHWWHNSRIFFNLKIRRINHFYNNKSDNDDNFRFSIRFGAGSYDRREEIKQLQNDFNLFSKRIVLLKGNAGTGKTNLLCNYTNRLMEKHKPVIYINAKDVNEKIESYFYKSFYGTENFLKLKRISIAISLFLKKIFSRKQFVVIEGVNENEDKTFCRDLLNFISSHNRKPFKYILTTREEHYSQVFKKQIDEYMDEKTKGKTGYIDLRSPNLTDFDLDYAISKYSNHFNFTGKITANTKRIIGRNFFMVRLFFELYKNSSTEVNLKEIHELFDAYIKHLEEINESMEILLDKVCEKMVSNSKYDFVCVTDIVDCIDLNTISSAISENILLYLYKGLSEDDPLSRDKKCISFLYDEFRDYLIANYLVNNSKNIVFDLSKIVEGRFSCTEGVTRFIYMYFREREDFDTIKKILSVKGIKHVCELSKLYSNASLHFITNYLLDTQEMPNFIEFEIIDKHLPPINAECLLHNSLNSYSEKPDLFIDLLRFALGTSGHFKRALELIKNKEVLEQIKKIIVENSMGESALSFIDELISDLELLKEYRFDSYDGRCFKIINHDYILFYKEKRIKLSQFLSYFHFGSHTYFNNKAISAYNVFYGAGWNLLHEYKRFYKSEFKTCNEYLVSVCKIPTSLVKNVINYKGCLKYLFSYNSGTMSAFFRILEIEDIIEKVSKEHYDN